MPLGVIFEKEHFRCINRITAAGKSGGVVGGQGRYVKGSMEHKVVQNLRAAYGDTSLF